MRSIAGVAISSFNTQPPEGGWNAALIDQVQFIVSTHSRPKAAGKFFISQAAALFCFNTQPPEGGWLHFWKYRPIFFMLFQHTAARRRLVFNFRIWHILPPCFNTQPPEGGWILFVEIAANRQQFQHTAARRRLVRRAKCQYRKARFNTQPPEGGWFGSRSL